MATWKDIAGLVLGHLNPSQVGTSLASSAGFKRRYGEGKTMRLVMEWMYQQKGRCVDCGTRLELQADHIRGREGFQDRLDADFIKNMTLRCRRCNVIRRPSHRLGGRTYLTAEAALMWILLIIRPRTLLDYRRLCRIYGMTMSDIRMDEAWAMARWLANEKPPAYLIENDEGTAYDLLIWPDSAITRTDVGLAAPAGSRHLYRNVKGSSVFGFLAQIGEDRVNFVEQPVSFLPFSTYDLGPRPPQSLAIRYSPPERKKGLPPKIRDLPPRGLRLVVHSIRTQKQRFHLVAEGSTSILSSAPTHGKLARIKGALEGLRLEAK